MESAVPWHGQSLDEPFAGDLVALVEQIAGINAQTARAIPMATWARCGGKSDPAELTDRMQSYDLVKSNLMRGTVHLVTLRQYWTWRPALEPTLKRLVAGFCRGIWDAVDHDKLHAFGLDLMSDERPRTRADLGSEASKHFTTAEPRRLGLVDDPCSQGSSTSSRRAPQPAKESWNSSATTLLPSVTT